MLLCSRTVSCVTASLWEAYPVLSVQAPLTICHFTWLSPSALLCVQAQDSDGYTPLMEAAAQGHLAVAKQLLHAHADAAMVDKVAHGGTNNMSRVCLIGE